MSLTRHCSLVYEFSFVVYSVPVTAGLEAVWIGARQPTFQSCPGLHTLKLTPTLTLTLTVKKFQKKTLKNKVTTRELAPYRPSYQTVCGIAH